MTAVRYDSNYAVQLVDRAPAARERDDEGEVVCCAECRAAVMIVCPNGHSAPVAYLTKTNGANLKPVPSRTCACGRPIVVRRARHCEICRTKDRTPPRNGFCNVRGCNDPVAAKAPGRGRPPTKCVRHWKPRAARAQ